MINEKSRYYPSHRLSLKNKLIVGGFELLCAAFLGLNISAYKIAQEKRKPLEKSVEPGYVIPNKLEILSEDLNENGKYETRIKYDSKTYPLKINEQGEPVVQN